MVAQVDEEKLAVVPLSVYPAAEPRLAANVGPAQIAAAVRTVGMHARSRG
jgi:hypothetical protein